MSSQDDLVAGEERFMRSDEFDFTDYRDYKMPEGMNMPFLGKINPTTDPENFLQQLSDLHKAELAAYYVRHPKSDPYNIGPEFPPDAPDAPDAQDTSVETSQSETNDDE